MSLHIRFALLIVGLLLCLAALIYAVLMCGTLAWISATPVSPGELEQVRWWFNVWTCAALLLVGAIVLLSVTLWRAFYVAPDPRMPEFTPRSAPCR
jgi:hypothetical protein